MYFRDLSPYEYSRTRPDPAVVNVGWLSRDQAYEAGDVPGRVLKVLRALAAKPVNLCRGFHICEFCPPPPRNGKGHAQPEPGTTGNGEVHVRGPDGLRYVAPSLIVHYIEVHRYRPPQSFIDAVVARGAV
jgi:hypothetical protein